MAMAYTPQPTGTGLRASVQRFGSFLASMVMPNIGAFIAWGLITALFIPTGWLPNARFGALVGPMITYLLPILIGYTGGRAIHGQRGAVVGAIATMGVVLSPLAYNPKLTLGDLGPQFLGALIIGPVTAFLLKLWDGLVDGKLKAGFEMLVDNFSAGIIGGAMAMVGLFWLGPVVVAISNAFGSVVQWLVNLHLLPLAQIIIEPAKVLFLNNAIGNGVLVPLGATQAHSTGQSILFMLESDPGPGLGILLAFMFFGIGIAKASAPGAIIIQFFGGIHEIYFPYVLMKPLLVLAAIGGGMTGVAINVAFQTGLRAPASPGSIFAVLIQTAPDSYIGVILSVIGAALVSFLISAVILRASRKRDLANENAGDLSAAVAATEANKGKSSSVLGGLAGAGTAAGVTDAAAAGATHAAAADGRHFSDIVFACDAGMGSSAMGASVLRNKIKKAGIEGVTVTNKSIANLDGTADLVITHRDLTARAEGMSPNSVHVSVDNFMNSPKYDEVVQLLQNQAAEGVER